MSQSIVYLDNNATTKPDPKVVEAMMPFITQMWGNPSSTHCMGQRPRAAIDIARNQTAKMLGCRDSEVTFTGSGTESTVCLLRGLTLDVKKPRIVTTTVEHSATNYFAKDLRDRGGEAVFVEVDRQGRLDMDQLADAVTPETTVVSTLWANNETGVLFDVKAIAALCKKRGVTYHCDATQVMGKVAVNLPEMGVDCATLAPHKYHGPKGVGVMFTRRGLRVAPLMIGSQERDRRGGTENVPGIVGSGVAAELAVEHISDMPRLRELRDDMEKRIVDAIEEATINGGEADRVPNTTNVGFARVHAEAMLMMLSQAGICASAGSACSSGSIEPSRVLTAMGVPDYIAHGSIRLSLCRDSTAADVDRLLEVLPGILDRLRQLMPTA